LKERGKQAKEKQEYRTELNRKVDKRVATYGTIHNP
jgi:hypothetical protein